MPIAPPDPWSPAPLFAVAIGVVGILNPRGPDLARACLGVAIAAGLAGAACVGACSVALRRGRAADFSGRCIAALCVGDLVGVVLTGPFRPDVFER